ncbi:MAG: hypothetical protein HKO55_10475 [Gammaproteobacteria bacterium]|nr:hypothetical protein [Gammaproteobacteria bacterium]
MSQGRRDSFIKYCGAALQLGGVLLILVNTLLTPMMTAIQDEAAMRTSDVYLLRLSLAWLTALFLLFGCIGVYLSQRATAGVFGTLAFVTAFVGNCLLLSIEWSNVFVLRAVAQSAPQALEALDSTQLLNIGFVSGAAVFALGWLLLAISVLVSRLLSRWGAIAIISGMLLVPVLAPVMGTAGMIAANWVLGIGYILLGRSVATES